MTKKVTISLENPEVRKVWNTVLEARKEVASWPAWKRGNMVVETDDDMSASTSVSDER